MSKLPRPDGHHTITPGFIAPKTAAIITFAEQAFGAKVVDRYDVPGGGVAHVELRVGDSVVMGGDPMHGMTAMPANLSYYVDDGAAVDAAYGKAVAAGAVSESEPKDQPWGYRSASVKDPGGNRWTICAVIELVSREEIQRRLAQMPPA